MKGFGKNLKVSDVVNVNNVCYEAGHYQISVQEECAFYRLEGFFEVM